MSDVRVDSAALPRFVVRVRHLDGGTLGTGVLVAPGRALTCAHVVAGVDEVLLENPYPLTDAGDGGSSGKVTVRVLARSAAPAGTVLWPFPDLAVLGWDLGGVVHGVAPLDCAVRDDPGPAVLSGDLLSGWGFQPREEGVDPPGSPASFEVEGVEGDGFITLKGGQAKRGLSGSALVNPRTGTVIGLMSATRDPGSALGGYVSPVAALARPDLFLPSAPAESAAVPGSGAHKVLAAVVQANRETVLEDRSPWLGVLVHPDAAGLVDRPWASFRKTSRSDPSDLLRADYGVVAYLFRDAELERVRREWCESPEPVGLLVVQGVGGAGKTRFAIQLCKVMRERGWVAGWLPDHDDVLRAGVPRLLVIDYVEASDPQRLRQVIAALARSGSVLAPARLVLLTRTRVGGLADPIEAVAGEASAAVRQVLAEGSDAPGATRALDLAQRDRLFRTAADAFAASWQEPRLTRIPALTGERYAWPVEVLFEALDRVLSGDNTGHPIPGPPVDRVLAHERKYWAAQLPGVDPALRDWAVAAATLAGAVDLDEAHGLLGVHPGLAGEAHRAQRARLIGWWKDASPGPGLLNPLRPDRLGEHLTARTLHDLEGADGSPAALLRAVLESPSDQQVTNALDLIARAVPGHPELTGTASAAIQDSFAAIVKRAAAQARSGSDGRVQRDLGTAMMRLADPELLAQLTLLAAANKAGSADLPWACTELGDFARESGSPQIARQLYATALTMDTDRGHSDPGSHHDRQRIAVDLQRLADLDAAAGRPEAARDGYQQALAGMRELAALDPGNPSYRRGVAVALSKLADLDAAAGRPEAAREGYQQYLAGMRELAGLDPGNPSYRQEVAVALQRLADLDAAAGRPEAAREGYQQYLAGMRELAGLDPGNPSYRQEVAVALQRLADLDAAAGRPEAAREGYQQYLAGMRELAGLDPGNPSYRQEVAVALQRLADLDAAAGRPEAALDGYQQALAIDQALAKANPGSPLHRHDVGVDLRELARLERLLAGNE